MQPGMMSHVEASTTGKRSMMLGQEGLANISSPKENTRQDWQGDYLYWGNEPWQILNKASTEFAGANPGLLILSGALGEKAFNAGVDEYNNVYEGPTLDTYLTTQYEAKLGRKERDATLDSTNSDEFLFGSHGHEEFADQKFTNKKWFAPTGKKIMAPEYGFSNEFVDDRAKQTGVGENYWTSACLRNNGIKDIYVAKTGNSIQIIYSSYSNLQSRAASVLDTKSMLFVSAANGGKTGNGVDAVLAPVSDCTTTKWKTTLDDSTNQSMEATKIRRVNDEVELTYNKKGAGTSISAIITDQEGKDILFYDRIQTVADTDLSNQTVKVNVPADFDKNNYKLKVFTEEYTDETATDYASAIVDIKVEVTGVTVKTEPTKVNYVEGQTFDPSGLVLTLHYNDGTSKDVIYNDTTKASFSFDKTVLAVKDNKVGITYDGKTVEQIIIVNAKENPVAPAEPTAPTNPIIPVAPTKPGGNAEMVPGVGDHSKSSVLTTNEASMISETKSKESAKVNEEASNQVEVKKEVKNNETNKGSKTNKETSNTKDKKEGNNIALLAIEATSLSLVGAGAIWFFMKKRKN